MSAINTNGINVNYPIPGQNNNSQGFRDNFASIKTNINLAGTEISDLQSKAVLKAALDNTVINNDMGNTLISNASTRSFRATTYNLGNALSGTVLIDVSLGDVQYGTIAGDTVLQFGGWAPTGTQSNVQLKLAIANMDAAIIFPSEVVSTNEDYGITTLENYQNIGGTAFVTVPYNVTEIDYRLSTVDCGNTITIEPYNRPRIATQVQQASPSPLGFPGDVSGTVAVDANYIYVCTDSYNATSTERIVTATYSGNLINCYPTTSLAVNEPIIFSGDTDYANTNIIPGQVYYIKTVPDGANITISETGFDGTAGSAFAVGAVASLAFAATAFSGTAIWKRIDLASVTGDDTVTGNLTVNGKATISGNVVASSLVTTTGNGIGYATGAGGTVTQGTSRTTAVTLNKPTGKITTYTTTLAANTAVQFTLNNSTIASTDLVMVQHVSGGTLGLYNVTATANSGNAVITLRNNSAGISPSEAPVIQFAVIKAVTS